MQKSWAMNSGVQYLCEEAGCCEEDASCDRPASEPEVLLLRSAVSILCERRVIGDAAGTFALRFAMVARGAGPSQRGRAELRTR